MGVNSGKERRSALSGRMRPVCGAGVERVNSLSFQGFTVRKPWGCFVASLEGFLDMVDETVEVLSIHAGLW